MGFEKKLFPNNPLCFFKGHQKHRYFFPGLSKNFKRTIVIIFLSISLNMPCGGSKEPFNQHGRLKVTLAHMWYGKLFQILNTSCLLKRPRQTVQAQIRQLLKKQSDQGFPVCYSECLLFWQAFCEVLTWYPTFYLRTEREKCLKF